MVSITRLSGGNTPADGGDPRTFPAIWNTTAGDLETDIAAALAKVPVTVSATAPSSPSNGDLWWDTVNEGLFMYYTGVVPAEWIVAGGGGGASVTISSTAPASPTAGDMWWDSDNGNLYIYYDDGTSQQWVAGNGPQVFVGTSAPAGYQGQLWFDSTTGKVYIYYDDGTSAQWVSAIGGSLAGSVVQVVSTAKTDTFTTTATNTWTDITGLSLNITPQSVSSKILLLAEIGYVDHSVVTVVAFRLMRDSTPVGVGDLDGVRPQVTFGRIVDFTNRGQSLSGNFLDSPGATSPITYKVQVQNTPNSGTTFINRRADDNNAIDKLRSIATLTAIEVAG